MPMERIVMKKVRQLLRLKFESQLSHREIGRALNISPGTVSYYSQAAIQLNLSWPLPGSLECDDSLIALIEPIAKQLRQTKEHYHQPDWEQVDKALGQKHVTQILLWEDYTKQTPAGKKHYSYAQFTRRYKAYAKKQKLSMRQLHIPGERAYIDYAGTTIPIYCRKTQSVLFDAQLFLMVLGASNYTFMTATKSQKIPDWIEAHVRAFEFFGGTPRLLVPDNLKSGVTKACQFEPIANPSYADLAEHYHCAILPARARKPKDKAKVENTVLVASRWIIARLLKQQFYSLEALNNAIASLLESLNLRDFQKRQGSRYSQFKALEQASLRPLEGKPYTFATFKNMVVTPDYHVRIDEHYYSVPYTLVGETVTCRISSHCIEVLHKNKRVASHVRSVERDAQSTASQHMPKAHQTYGNWTPQTFLDWAERIGHGASNFASEVIKDKSHPEQCSRIHHGLKRLHKQYGSNRLEKACSRALALQCISFHSIASILKNGLDKLVHITPLQQPCTPLHNNLRGGNYYQPLNHPGEPLC
jgi:transposase